MLIALVKGIVSIVAPQPITRSHVSEDSADAGHCSYLKWCEWNVRFRGRSGCHRPRVQKPGRQCGPWPCYRRTWSRHHEQNLQVGFALLTTFRSMNHWTAIPKKFTRFRIFASGNGRSQKSYAYACTLLFLTAALGWKKNKKRCSNL